MLFFRGDVPIEEFAATQPAVLRPLVKPFLRRIMPRYPFEEAFFLDEARLFLQSLSLPLVLLGGVNRVDTMQAAVDEGFSFVAMGRALLRDPDLVARMARGELTQGRCTHCNLCAPTIYSREGTHCVVR
jgi:4,4'-dithiodibutanoate disulfide reductase